MVVELGPKYRGEVTDPGRQGIRQIGDINPACGSATSFEPIHHGFYSATWLVFLDLVSVRSIVSSSPGAVSK
jgi:hypothetical protein